MLSYYLPAIAILTSCGFAGPSVITARLDDPKAVYFEAPQFTIHADGKTDDSAALQAAIDKADVNREGLVFIPAGRYAIARTVYIPAGVRLFGYGATRPLFLLPDDSPDFQKGMGVMFMFIGARFGGAAAARFRIPSPPPGTVPPREVPDANPGTFYSAMSNIDIEIGRGNPAAVGVRFHVAQHSFLSHMDLRIGSGLAGLYQVGNMAAHLRFSGGRYGILTERSSPAWPFVLLDSTFEAQRDAAIREHEARLTLIRNTFKDVPVGIEIDRDYYDHLWVQDCRFENIRRAALIISGEQSRLNAIGIQNAIFSSAPTLARFRESGREVAGKGPIYRVRSFNHGVIVPALGRMGEIGTLYDAEALTALPAPFHPAIRLLPPTAEWVNVRTLGAIGDGKSDDTAALRKAIQTRRVLYFPSGRYLISDTLELQPTTVIIGLHPSLTRIQLADDTPAFRGIGAPRPMISAPRGGANILSGFGVDTGGVNPRAVGVLWRSGEHSLIDDVRFHGGHGSGTMPYNSNATGDPDPRRRWDSQYPSLWVADGGGGTFADIWTPSTFAQSGMYVSDTKTPGRVYQMSAEHHVRVEIKLERVENWELIVPQTEEEGGEGPEALALELSNCRNITVVNLHAYRVTRTKAPYPAAVRLYNSSAIRFRNAHVNAESGVAFCDGDYCGTFLRANKFPYENTIQDVTRGLEVRDREFAVLDIPAVPPPAPPPGPAVKKLEGGFSALGGAAVDASGKLYFVDRRQQRIFGWSAREGLTIERDSPLDPVNLAVDRSGHLLVLSSFGAASTVYSFRPGSAMDQITVLEPREASPRPGARILLPANFWKNGEFRDQLNLETYEFKTLAEMFREDVSAAAPKQYVSPDGSLVLPAGRVVSMGPPDARGLRFSHNLNAYGFLSAVPGDRIHVSNSSENVTYSASLRPDGSLTDLKPFVNRGGESVATAPNGNVYVANGQVFVYNPAGKEIGRIDVPERPIGLVFGGSENKTLFILSHRTLYALEIR